ncbi:WD40 repeat-like protein [Mollisia scopiformis]|uniref:WD40 repeat-like protein n=1 Tax=Mollisia scopiformis TaxID=149040 RepID=A0A194X1T0_MOLSC|nr:WD40 repeat-like protein [Mollisia scopiformis]KUJ14158.1 WD40 repeat-like protein [Mollisia scopiformis]
METGSSLVESCIFSQQVSAESSVDEVEAVPTVCQFTLEFVVIAMSDGKIHVFDIHGTSKETLSTSLGTIWALNLRGNTLASGGTNNSIEIWDVSTCERKQILEGHTSTVRCIVLLSDKNRMISTSRDTTIRVWNIRESICEDVLAAHAGTVRAVAMSTAENFFISGSHDGTACVWRITDNGLRRLHTLEGHKKPITCVLFVGDKDSRAVTAGMDCYLRLWDFENGTCLASFESQSTPINQILKKDEGLITSDASGCVSVWSTKDALELVHRFQTHSLGVVSLDFSGSKIVSGGKDGLVRFRDLESGHLQERLKDASAVWKVGFLGSDRVALVISRDGRTMIEIWNTS